MHFIFIVLTIVGALSLPAALFVVIPLWIIATILKNSRSGQ